MIRPFLIAGGVDLQRADLWWPVLEGAAYRFDIVTRLRKIHWIATLVHESARFTRLEEDLHYRAITLLRLFPLTPSRPWGFTPQDAADFALRPEAIANRIYADRMGNGNEVSGDGWKYRGRGPIQITGRWNYQAASEACDVDLVSEPELLLLPTHGAFAAGNFWKENHCNEWADADDLVAIRRRVNGGTIGVDEVRLLVDRMKHT